MKKQQQPDILLIVLDTLRADRLSCYSYPREVSPNLDAFAEDAVLFERAISPAQWTIPAHASLFTGNFPSTHMTNQIYDKHTQEQPTLAELLRDAGYTTLGFCNNPLLGVVDNGLDRGFEEFYNYSGFFPERPDIADTRARPSGRLMQRLGRLLNRINAPVQDALTKSDLILKIALHPRIIPLWQRHLNFRGNTKLSLRDMTGYLNTRRKRGRERPLFAFLNLMETHLPFGPPPRFIHRFAPYYRTNREARDFMREYNQSHYRWMIPLTEPLTELQDRILNDMYAAEIAYEDHALRQLYAYLNDPRVRDNTVVFIVSDHGEGMNHHNFVGHSLVAYDDLLHVPLLVRYPPHYGGGQRIPQTISTRRIFHTALKMAGVPAPEQEPAAEATRYLPTGPLPRTPDEAPGPETPVFAEAYTPDTLLALMENYTPDAIDTFRCRSMRRAVYQQAHKLITVGEQPDELFAMPEDPGELHNLIAEKPDLADHLFAILRDFVAEAKAQRPSDWEDERVDIESDEQLTERLRGLGYMQ